MLRDDGTGGFRRPQTYSSDGAGPTAVAIADVTGDAAPDPVVANKRSDEHVVLAGTGAGTGTGTGTGRFAEPVRYATGGWWPYALTVAGFDGNGAPDVAAFNNGLSAEVSLHLNRSPKARARGMLR